MLHDQKFYFATLYIILVHSHLACRERTLRCAGSAASVSSSTFAVSSDSQSSALPPGFDPVIVAALLSGVRGGFLSTTGAGAVLGLLKKHH